MFELCLIRGPGGATIRDGSFMSYDLARREAEIRNGGKLCPLPVWAPAKVGSVPDAPPGAQDFPHSGDRQCVDLYFLDSMDAAKIAAVLVLARETFAASPLFFTVLRKDRARILKLVKENIK